MKIKLLGFLIFIIIISKIVKSSSINNNNKDDLNFHNICNDANNNKNYNGENVNFDYQNDEIVRETVHYNNRLKNNKQINQINHNEIVVVPLSPFQEGIYKIRPAFPNVTLGGKNGGHSFISNLKDSWELGGYNSWVFNKDNGILQVLNNGDIIISGPIVPTNQQSSCHTWFVNMMFSPLPKDIKKTPRKDLNRNSYQPKGTINPQNWQFYQPVQLLNSWIGIGCNHISNIQFDGTTFPNKPLQFGIGANGKNENNGILFSIPIPFGSKSKTYKRDYIDINVDIVLIS
ncbi:hypothetical protein ACTFIV_008422 [Dictyostelium citrinum]